MRAACLFACCALAAGVEPPRYTVEHRNWLLPNNNRANAPLSLLASQPQPGQQMQQIVAATTQDLEKLAHAPQRSKEGVRLVSADTRTRPRTDRLGDLMRWCSAQLVGIADRIMALTGLPKRGGEPLAHLMRHAT